MFFECEVLQDGPHNEEVDLTDEPLLMMKVCQHPDPNHDRRRNEGSGDRTNLLFNFPKLVGQELVQPRVSTGVISFI